MQKKAWESYEQVAQFLLDQMAEQFDLSHVEGKQTIEGKRSGTIYEIDGGCPCSGGHGTYLFAAQRLSGGFPADAPNVPSEHFRKPGASLYEIMTAC